MILKDYHLHFPSNVWGCFDWLIDWLINCYYYYYLATVHLTWKPICIKEMLHDAENSDFAKCWILKYLKLFSIVIYLTIKRFL